MKIFSAKLLLLVFETWCLLWLLHQVRWGEEKKKNPPTGSGIEAARKTLFFSKKAQTLEPNSASRLIMVEEEILRYLAKKLIRLFHVRWATDCWFHLHIKVLLVMWIYFLKHPIEQSAHMASLYSTCEYFSWSGYFYSESEMRTILIMRRTMKENAYWTMNTFRFADSVWDETWSSVELIHQQPQKLLTFQTVFTIFMIYRLRPASAAPPSYVTSLASVEGQDIFNISCHLLFPSGRKWGRRGIFASRHWRLIL